MNPETAARRIATYRQMLSAFNSNDLSLVNDFVAEDMVYTIPGNSPIAGTTVGVQAHLEVLRRARELTDGTLSLTPLATAVDGDYLLVWGRICARRGGKELSCDHCVMYRFVGDRVAEGRTVPTNLYAFDEFWA